MPCGSYVLRRCLALRSTRPRTLKGRMEEMPDQALHVYKGQVATDHFCSSSFSHQQALKHPRSQIEPIF